VQYKHIDLADGESHALGQPRDRQGNKVPSRGLEDYLDDATSFIAAHLRRGCVLVHCGAGKSRSVAVVIAYLCRYAGMSFAEAAAFVAERRPGACPAPCFAEAIKRWLRLDELATKGPRR
jgi:protein-tyrosine phosphatase